MDWDALRIATNLANIGVDGLLLFFVVVLWRKLNVWESRFWLIFLQNHRDPDGDSSEHTTPNRSSDEIGGT